MEHFIIFDMDGVLVNTEPLQYELWKETFAQRGLTIDYDHYKGCIGSNPKRLMQLIWEGYGVDFREDTDIRPRYEALKKAYLRQHPAPAIEGAAETVRALKEKGYRMAVASSSPQAYIEKFIAQLGLTDCFELLFSADRVGGRAKPAPDVFLATAAALGADPGDCVVIEDSHNGVLAARAAGMRVLGFPNPDSGEQDLSQAEALFFPFRELLKHL